jgi:hypothetical protein
MMSLDNFRSARVRDRRNAECKVEFAYLDEIMNVKALCEIPSTISIFLE